MPAVEQRWEWYGRYRVLGLLGEGANGIVFAAEDPAVGVRVALKVLRAGFGEAADLKREFRLVADISHPNLVLPYALESDEEQIFFTMELVTGSPILEWLHGHSSAERDTRIRETFRQLAEALWALHQRGLLHRDVKANNVLVEPNGRVALLDFGLVRPAEAVGTVNGTYFGGTPAYLAPELLLGRRPSAAADAYALGVLLHMALMGRLPFHDDARESVISRMRNAAAPEVATGPALLSEICRGLLHPDPVQRLSVPGVIAALNTRPHAAVPFVAPSLVIERDEELARLRSAYDQVKAQQRPTVVHLPGKSGMGKSALLRAFARQMRDEAWVLEGKAYERDAVPYKALDAAMDQLAQRLGALPDVDKATLHPTAPEALCVLFPALGSALSIAPFAAATMDAVTRRRWGALALSELLSKVSERFGLILMLDDLQWGDLDSARLLIDLLTPPGPALLVLLAYRAEQGAAPFLALYRRWEANNLASETVAVEPLSPAAAMRMAEVLSGGARSVDIARESDGSPFIIEMLLSSPAGATLSFESALSSRLETLSAAGLAMLGAIALAGRPVARDRVPFTPEIPTESWAAWSALVSKRLLRSEGTSATDHVEVYHDRIRDAVTRRLQPIERLNTHRALGESFAAASDDEGAASHFAAAGDTKRAFPFASNASRAALDALAFERAAQLLALAIECCPPSSGGERRNLVMSRARALANAGHGAEAAPLFMECAAEAKEELAGYDLRREAMEQFLVAGRIDEGRAVMQQLLDDLGVWRPRSAWLTTAALYAALVRLVFRGPKVRPPRRISDRERLLLDTFGSIGKGFASYDAMLGAWFFLRAARRALDWGESKLAVRGIAYTACLLGFSGSPGDRKRAQGWLTAGESVANATADGHGFAFCQVSRGMIQCCAGEWQAALATFDAAAETLDGKYAASDWEAVTAKNTSLFALIQTGDLAELEIRAISLTREARDRGDLSLEVESNLYLALTALSRDNVEAARRCVDRNIALWTVRGYHFQHWIALRFRTLAWLYDGGSEKAFDLMNAEMPRARAANLTGMQVVRIEGHDFRGRAALGAAAQATGSRRAALLASVEKDIECLIREKRLHAVAPAEMLQAGVALLGGDRTRALAHLRSAGGAYVESAMTLHALTAQWHAATLECDRAELQRLEQGLRARGIEVPARWARMHLGMETS